MIRTCLRTLVFGMLLAPLAGTAIAADPIPAAQFERLHTLVKPTASEEAWAQIPWLTSLWEAREQAAEAGKPILLWEMDGNPLGCT